jgi:23S rRNA (adenine2503-C2)-methyltransferase
MMDRIGEMTAALPIVGLSVSELTSALQATGLEPKPARMRARQLWNWVYVHGARDFASMTNLA